MLSRFMSSVWIIVFSMMLLKAIQDVNVMWIIINSLILLVDIVFLVADKKKA